MKLFRLSWKGVIFSSEALLYAEPDTPQFLLIPIVLFLYLPKLLFSYLKLTERGLELLYWPNFRISASWEDITHIGEVLYLGKFTHDALYLRNKSGEICVKVVDRHKGIRERKIIPLTDFQGWPKGVLYHELLRLIPEKLNTWKDLSRK